MSNQALIEKLKVLLTLKLEHEQGGLAKFDNSPDQLSSYQQDFESNKDLRECLQTISLSFLVQQIEKIERESASIQVENNLSSKAFNTLREIGYEF